MEDLEEIKNEDHHNLITTPAVDLHHTTADANLADQERRSVDNISQSILDNSVTYQEIID